MFRPPFCPHRDCAHHRAPGPEFCTRHGSFRPRCRAHPVPRFRCRGCRRTFSRQTFRVDYRDHKPHLNAPLFDLASMGVGIRMAARRLGLSRRATEEKLRKLARHCRRLNLTLRRPLHGHVELHFDELETFEANRSLRPLTVPVLIETRTRYCIWAESETIRPKGKMTPKRREKLRIEHARRGLRKDRSRRAIRRTLNRGRELVAPGARVTLYTDEKTSYRGLARRAFGSERLTHHTTNSQLARTTWNPLFAINHEDARLRDMLGRLRRQSWLVTQRRRYLDLVLQVQMAFRNLVQARFNRDDASPAQLLGFVPRRLTKHEVLSWRMEWGKRSLHPLSRGRGSVARFEAMAAPAG